MDIFLVFLVFVFGYAAGWFRASKNMLEKMLDKPDIVMALLKKYQAENSTVVVSSVRQIEVKKENGAFYLYAQDDGEFLGQGTTLEQALEIVKQRFPGQNFAGHIDAESAAAMDLNKQN